MLHHLHEFACHAHSVTQALTLQAWERNIIIIDEFCIKTWSACERLYAIEILVGMKGRKAACALACVSLGALCESGLLPPKWNTVQSKRSC